MYHFSDFEPTIFSFIFYKSNKNTTEFYPATSFTYVRQLNYTLWFPLDNLLELVTHLRIAEYFCKNLHYTRKWKSICSETDRYEFRTVTVRKNCHVILTPYCCILACHVFVFVRFQLKKNNLTRNFRKNIATAKI